MHCYLELAQSRMKDELTEQYEIFLVSWFRSLTAMFSLSAWAVVGVVAFLILLISVLLVLFNKNTALRKIFIAIAVVSLIATIFANISAYSLYSYMNDKSNAIIMKEEVSLKSTPNNSGTVLIMVHEGRKVRILEGPFAGVEGVIVRIKKSRRVVVELPGMLAVATTYITPDALELIEA